MARLGQFSAVQTQRRIAGGRPERALLLRLTRSLLVIDALVIVACLRLGGLDEDARTSRANRPLLVAGLLGNLAVLGYRAYDDPVSLVWCAGLLALGGFLFLLEQGRCRTA